MTPLIDTLRSLVGPTNVITKDDMTAWEQD